MLFFVFFLEGFFALFARAKKWQKSGKVAYLFEGALQFFPVFAGFCPGSWRANFGKSRKSEIFGLKSGILANTNAFS